MRFKEFRSCQQRLINGYGRYMSQRSVLNEVDKPREDKMEAVFLTFVFVLSIFLGFELISKVPSTLHTPLMSGSNAISGITLIGSLASLKSDNVQVAIILGTLAVAFATINVVGGYAVTNRMLEMFKKKDKGDA